MGSASSSCEAKGPDQLSSSDRSDAVLAERVDVIVGGTVTEPEVQDIPVTALPAALPSTVPRGPPKNANQTHWVSATDWQRSEHWFRPGDLVEFSRLHLYNHWGIYIGNGLVAHVTARGLLNSSTDILGIAAFMTAAAPSLATTESAVGMLAAGRLAVQLGDKILYASPAFESTPLPTSGTGTSKEIFYVRLDPIEVVAGRDQFRVNNLVHRAGNYVARTFEETFELVASYLNRAFNYDTRTSNCEHFATHLRYKPKS